MSQTSRRLGIRLREYASVLGPSLILLILGFWVAYQFVDPAPPRELTMATGSREGAYFAYGMEYQRTLAHNDIRLQLMSTKGSAENLERLRRGDVQVALVQGGLHSAGPNSGLLGLGSVYLEPMWCFHRRDLPLETLAGLAGKRVAIGPEGSGTRPLALQLLALNGISPEQAELDPAGGSSAADMLVAGTLDAALFVVSPQAGYIQELMRSPGVALFDVRRARAYASRLPFLEPVVLDRGEIDLAADLPPEDVTLLAAATQLVVSSDIHPALIDLLLQSASEIHSQGGMFETPGQFPAATNLDYPLSKEARRFYKHGPPLLQRHLPFWLATFLDRMKVMFLPLLALLIPLFKVLPPAYRWRIRSRIYRWYRDLESVDPQTRHHDVPLDTALETLDNVEKQASKTEVPNAYMDELYTLRMHIEMIRKRLQNGESKSE